MALLACPALQAKVVEFLSPSRESELKEQLMQIIRRFLRLLRRIMGTQNVIDALERIDSQSADGRARADRSLHDLREYLEGEMAALHTRLTRQISDLPPQIPAMVSTGPHQVRPTVSQELQTLHRLAQVRQPDGRLGLLDLDELEGLSKSGVFIVGNARSGTTILFKCINLAKDVYLLGEGNLYANHGNPEFRSSYNETHEHLRNPRAKGFFLPEPPVSLQGGMAYMAWLARHYRYVGDKLAFGVGCTRDGVPHQDAFFEFQTRYFFLAKYF
ncbi:MAG: hypothetical protein ACYSWU_19805, partial [Planctomycetota bacterium]